MTCNCDNDGSNEYIIELNQQGAPGVKGDKGDTGYSPIVTYTTDSNGVQINIVNETTTEQTPVLPSKSYTDTQLAGKLNIDGSNASNPISFGNLTFSQLSGAINPKLSGNDDKVQIQSLVVKQGDSYSPTYLYATNNQGVCITNNTNTYLTVATNTLSFRNGTDTALELYGQYTSGTNQLKSTKDFYFNNQNAGKFYYGNGVNYSEIATKADIPTVGNGTITITQDGTTKGTFTTNQSGNTTIALDSGVTNPLSIELEGDNVTYSLNMGINTSTHKAEMSYGLATSGSYIGIPIKLIGSTSNPLELTDLGMGVNTLSLNIDSNILEINQDNELTVKEMVGCDSITGGSVGLVPAPSAGDENKFLKGDGTWDTVGGGGSTYTAGTGINITNDTISVKNNQSFAKVTIANGYSTGEGLYGWLDDGSSTIPLVRVSDLDDVIIGDDGSKLVLHGDETRPSYFDSHTTSYLALYSDIPSVSSFLEASDITTGTTNGTIAVNNTDIAVYGLGSAAYTSSSDYATSIQGGKADTAMQPSSNDSITGTKEFTTGTAQFDNGSKLEVRGQNTLFLRGNTVAHGAYLGLGLRGNDSTNNVTINQMYFTANNSSDIATLRLDGLNLFKSPYIYNGYTRLGQISVTNSNINFATETGTALQYNGSEIAKKSDIPDVSQLQEKLTAGDGIELASGVNIPLGQTLPYTFNSSYSNTEFVNISNFDQTKERVVIIEVPISTGYLNFYMSNQSRRGFFIDSNDLSNIWVADGSSYGQSNQTSFPVLGSHNYLKFVIDTDNKFDVYYGYDKETWTLLLSKSRDNQNTDTWEYGVNIYNEATTGWTLNYLEAYYPLANGEVISCNNTIQRVSNLVTSVDSSSTNSQYPSAKLFYDTVGDIETLINAL